jgi:hypothetical protein
MANEMISRQNQKQGIFAPGRSLQGCDSHGRRSVAARGFQKDCGWLNGDLPHLFGNDKAMVFVADQERRGQSWQAMQSKDRLLEQALVAVAGQGPVLLGVGSSGEGPETGACAATENDWNQGTVDHD